VATKRDAGRRRIEAVERIKNAKLRFPEGRSSLDLLHELRDERSEVGRGRARRAP
jgi:hypothetical protein